MNDDRKSILAKIKALLSKTTENGCTEAEAMSALDKARQWMDAHDISDTELAFDGEEVIQTAARKSDPDGIRFGMGLSGAVAMFCDCKAWGEHGRDGRLIFFGLETDTVMASWLLDTLEQFVRRQSLQFLADMGRARGGETDLFGAPLDGHDREHKRKSFILGCVGRIVERLKAAALERRGATGQGTGKSMIVVKNAVVTDAFRKLGIRLSNASSRGIAADPWSHQRGQQVGDTARFNRPVSGSRGAAPLAIGIRGGGMR